MWIGIRIRVIQNLTSHRIQVPCSPPLPADAVRVVLPIFQLLTQGRQPQHGHRLRQKHGNNLNPSIFAFSYLDWAGCLQMQPFYFCTSWQTKGRRSASWIVQFTGKIQKAAWYVDQHVGGTYWQAGSATFASTVKAWHLSQCLGWTKRSLKIDGNRNTSPQIMTEEKQRQENSNSKTTPAKYAKYQLHHQHSLISMVSRPSAAAAACFIGCTKACGVQKGNANARNARIAWCKKSLTLRLEGMSDSSDSSKIYTSTTFVWRQLCSWNKISRPQGTTPHPQHRWRPTSLQSWALTTSSSPLHLDQSTTEKHGNRWKPVETKHIETHKGLF